MHMKLTGHRLYSIEFPLIQQQGIHGKLPNNEGISLFHTSAFLGNFISSRSRYVNGLVSEECEMYGVPNKPTDLERHFDGFSV